MIGMQQAQQFLQQLREERRQSNQDILGAMELSFIRQIERESNLKVHRLFGGYYVRKRFFGTTERGLHHLTA